METSLSGDVTAPLYVITTRTYYVQSQQEGGLRYDTMPMDSRQWMNEWMQCIGPL